MKRSLVSLLVVGALLGLLTGPVAAAQGPSAAAAPASIQLPITGSLPGGTFSGTFDLTRFARSSGQLVAIGTLSGTLTDTLGNVIGTVTSIPIQLPVSLAQSTGSCQILDLVLGPLDLNLLGLVVHLDQVHLNITAQQGPGNLLGNLLCAVAHLLDNNGPASGLAALLNRILSLL